MDRKGKPITSSVPSIRFNANAEAIEELHVSDGEGTDSLSDITPLTDISKKCPAPKYKRSSSIDINSTDASPPSDPWRFFSDFKKNITKSVEGKITEYKTRTVDGEGSPKINKAMKDGAKDNSSLSDSEDLSESSISRTCGITSTTDGVEMSSDDETPSISEKEKKSDPSLEEDSTSAQKQKIIIIRDNKVQAEKLVPNKFLENLQNINMGIESAEDLVESGIDALSQIDNIDVDEDAVIVKEVSGQEIKESYFKNNTKKEMTIFSPKGFVDLRHPRKKQTWLNFINIYRMRFLILLAIVLYFLLPLTQYMYGFIAGNIVMFITALFYISYSNHNDTSHNTTIVEIPAIKEHQVPTKYEGWINEYPDKYDPDIYHISQTQSVYLKLQGKLLKISHTNQKIPKRAMWNEPEYKLNFSRHRIYNLGGASVSLLPPGLTKIRHWSKKYPICVSLDVDQFNVDYPDRKKKSNDDKGKKCNDAQIFSKLADELSESEVELSPDLNELDKPRDSPDIGSEFVLTENGSGMEDETEKTCKTEGDESFNKTVIYLFARTDREKEHWFRRLKLASRKEISDHGDDEPNLNDFTQVEYLKFMSKYLKAATHSNSFNDINEETQFFDTHWLNALMSRLFYDCMNNESFISKVKDRIQRKLSTIKLPYFIEEITITELTLGKTPPCVSKAEKPVMDEWGLWIYLHTNYEGHAVVTLQTKINLMKLKHPQEADKNQPAKSPIFHSDVDDSAESSSDDESPATVTNPTERVSDNAGSPTSRSEGGKSKKFIRMVDRIAESRIFQVASEYKYIKKAIEGVSNTDLGLKVELKCLEGCLVLNVAAPPTDRIWVGFRPSPKLQLTAHPIVGERNINFLQVTSWIEKKLYKEFQKILVYPNMEDLYIPVMTQVLP